MTRTVAVMAVPDPNTCTPEQWDTYLESVDVSALTWGEVDAHRARVELYTARLVREQATARSEASRLLDARDQTSAEADALSARCGELHRQLLEAGEAVLEARRAHPVDSSAAQDARERETHLAERLAVARAELAIANLRAIQATLDAR